MSGANDRSRAEQVLWLLRIDGPSTVADLRRRLGGAGRPIWQSLEALAEGGYVEHLGRFPEGRHSSGRAR